MRVKEMVTNQRSFGLLILLVNTLGNVLGTVWRICILILEYKGLREHDGLQREDSYSECQN